jgi:hypothetical protein
MKQTLNPILVVLVIVFSAATVRAEVVDSSAHGFTVRSAVIVPGSASQTYQKFVEGVGKWWDSEHTYSGNASNLSIDARLGGYFYEKLPGGGFVEHMRVVYSDPGKMLRMSGGLGPLQELGAAGAMTVAFVEKDSKTEVTMTYAAGGHMKGGLGSIAGIVNSVLSLQLNHFHVYAEEKQSGSSPRRGK